MRWKLLSKAANYIAQSKSRKVWARIVGTLAAIVVFCTTYALILPAITQETEVFCGKEEHTHSEECYKIAEESKSVNIIKNMICTKETLGIHAHNNSCYDGIGAVICGYADYVVHIHDANCYDEDGNLVCTLPEIGTHVHGDGCYTVNVVSGHTHGEECYTTDQGELICQTAESAGHTHGTECYQGTQNLICGMEASEEHPHDASCYETVSALICQTEQSAGHTHGIECYAQNKVLTCTQEEAADTEERVLTCTKTQIEIHTHSENCYANGVLSCGKLEIHQHVHSDACFEIIKETAAATETNTDNQGESTAEAEPVCGKEEHTHDDECYSDKTADIETADGWEKTFADIELTGVYADDLLAIAKSQLGYTESSKNYIIDEDDDNIKKGYSRFGDWYGDKYGDWCAMYVSFCLSYSEVTGVPYGANCQNYYNCFM